MGVETTPFLHGSFVLATLALKKLNTVLQETLYVRSKYWQNAYCCATKPSCVQPGRVCTVRGQEQHAYVYSVLYVYLH